MRALENYILGSFEAIVHRSKKRADDETNNEKDENHKISTLIPDPFCKEAGYSKKILLPRLLNSWFHCR